MTDDERNKTALMVMVMICVMTGWIPGSLGGPYLGVIAIFIFVGLAALILPVLVLIAPDRRALWLLLASFLLALTASTASLLAAHGRDALTILPFFFTAWGVAFVGGLPGVLIGAGVQWLCEELRWRRMYSEQEP